MNLEVKVAALHCYWNRFLVSCILEMSYLYSSLHFEMCRVWQIHSDMFAIPIYWIILVIVPVTQILVENIIFRAAMINYWIFYNFVVVDIIMFYASDITSLLAFIRLRETTFISYLRILAVVNSRFQKVWMIFCPVS